MGRTVTSVPTAGGECGRACAGTQTDRSGRTEAQHDAAAAKEVLFRLCLLHPEVTIVSADSAYVGRLVDEAKRHLNLTINPVSRPKDASGFVVLPRRWVVERSLAWMMHAHRHARDQTPLVQHPETLITWAAITLMTVGSPGEAPPPPAGQGKDPATTAR